jgi:parallel beta-helix repeat protein
MTLSDARKTLGLGPDDDPRPFLNELKEARERIAEMVRTAPNDILAERYQKGLVDFDQALAAVREHLEPTDVLPLVSESKETPQPAESLPPVIENSATAFSPPSPAETGTEIPSSSPEQAAKIEQPSTMVPHESASAPALEITLDEAQLTPPTEAATEAAETPQSLSETPSKPAVIPPTLPSSTSELTGETAPPSPAERPTKLGSEVKQSTDEATSAEITQTPSISALKATSEASTTSPHSQPAIAKESTRAIPIQDSLGSLSSSAKEVSPSTPSPQVTHAPEKSDLVFEPAQSLPPSAPPLPPVSEEIENDEDDSTTRKSNRAATVAWILTVVLLCIAGMLFYLKREEDLRLQKLEEVIELGKRGNSMIDNRRWPDAKRIFDQIEILNPDSSLLAEGRTKIAEGIAEEDSQFIGFVTGQAKASLEAKRWDEAAASAQQILDRFPNEKEATNLLKQISEGKALEADRLTLATARDMLQQRKWDEAISAANKILASRPGDDDAEALLADATAAREKAAADVRKARELLLQARALDKGQFDQAILDLLREASLLSPEDSEIKAQLEKLASYARTIRVPGDFATPAEALEKARDKDRVIIGAGTWEGPLVVTSAVELQGAGPDKTIIQCSAQKGSPITLAGGAKGARVTGLSLRHESFDPGDERFSAALVRGVLVDFVDCRFQDASGHGLAVIEGGHAIANRCRFADNGWNGVAASGAGTLLEVRESESLRNFGHGVESWDGAAIILAGNRCDDNSGNGVHADNGGGSVTLEKNQFSGNREFGVVLSSAGSGRATGNTSRSNLLGGFAIRAAAAGVAFSGNEATKNTGPGLILDLGLSPAAYAGNTSVRNMGLQIMPNANLTVKDEPLPDAPPENPTSPPKAVPVFENQ